MSIKHIVRQILGKSDFGEHRDVVVALSIPAACLSPEGSFGYMMFFYDF